LRKIVSGREDKEERYLVSIGHGCDFVSNVEKATPLIISTFSLSTRSWTISSAVSGRAPSIHDAHDKPMSGLVVIDFVKIKIETIEHLLT